MWQSLDGKKTYIVAGLQVAAGLGKMFFPDTVGSLIPDDPVLLIGTGLSFITTRLGIAKATDAAKSNDSN